MKMKARKIWPEIQNPRLYTGEHRMNILIRKVAVKHDVHVSMMKSPRQFKGLIKARQEFVYKAVKAGHTREEIGQFLNRHNSTITGIYHKYIQEYETYE